MGDKGYKVRSLVTPIEINGVWDKAEWQRTDSLHLDFLMGDTPKFRPKVEAKLLYDANFIYVIFRVLDQYVKCLITEPNGPVWTDSCVEFFFAPNLMAPEKYFNLEVNCGGTPLLFYNLVPREQYTIVDAGKLAKLEIAHSLPSIVQEEITEPLEWTLEYRLPLGLLAQYADLIRPEPGVKWRANFYKIADNTSNPHYLTWNLVRQSTPDFHLPQFFGTLLFQ